MTSVEVPLITDRPACLTEVGGSGTIMEAVDYYFTLLISNSPDEMTCEYSDDPKFVTWCIRSLPAKEVLHTETIPSKYHRQMLARIAVEFMDGQLYGGFQRLRLSQHGKLHRAAFYMGNDGLCGYWFKGNCSSALDEA
jgi:hypothetical protein